MGSNPTYRDAMDIAIFGAGVAGMAAAVALQANGHRCRIYEKSLSHLDAGMAFILMPQALEGLASLGARLPMGAPLRRYLHRDEAGKVLFEVLMPGGVVCMRRRELLQALQARIPPGALIAGQGLSHFQFDGERARCAWLTAPPGATAGLSRPVTADLFIAADGVRSSARRALFPDMPSTPARVFEMVGLLQDRECAQWAGADFNKFHALGGGTAFGLLPTGGDTVVWYMQFDAQALPSGGLCSSQEAMAFVQRRLRGWAEPVAHAVARADFSKAYLWRPIEAGLPPSFHRANLVLAGDAAHPLLPFSSQGVSAAILDAIALAQALGSGGSIAEALLRYSIERRQACLPHVARGRELTEKFFEAVGGGGAIPMALPSSGH